MRELFRGYYRPTQREFETLWGEGLLVLDANVLLNLYRYTQATRSSMLTRLHDFGDRLWLPHQAASEFHRNRLAVIAEQAGAYDYVEKELDSVVDSLNGKLGKFSRHPLIDSSAILSNLRERVGELKSRLQEQRQSHPEFFKSDPILEELTKLFEGKVGQPFSPEELEAQLKVAEKRFEKKTPPGYEDSKEKSGDKQFGDYLLWEQTMRMAAIRKKPILLVTDDSKADWWQQLAGKTMGPRPELIAEIAQRAEVLFYLYRPDQFMEYPTRSQQVEIKEEIIAEVRQVQRDQQRVLRERRERIALENHRLSQKLVATELSSLRKFFEALRERLHAVEAELRSVDATRQQWLKEQNPDRSITEAPHTDQRLRLLGERREVMRRMDELRQRLTYLRRRAHDHDSSEEQSPFSQLLGETADPGNPFLPPESYWEAVDDTEAEQDEES